MSSLSLFVSALVLGRVASQMIYDLAIAVAAMTTCLFNDQARRESALKALKVLVASKQDSRHSGRQRVRSTGGRRRRTTDGPNPSSARQNPE